MGRNTNIEWCDHTAQIWEGCTKIAPGCQRCYAEEIESRYGNDVWGKLKPRKWTKTGPRLLYELNRDAGLEKRLWHVINNTPGINTDLISRQIRMRIDHLSKRFTAMLQRGLIAGTHDHMGGWQTIAPWQDTTVFLNDLADFFEDHLTHCVDHAGRKVFRCPCGACKTVEPTIDSCETCGPGDAWPALQVADLRAEAFQLIEEYEHLIFMLLTKRPENIPEMWPRIGQRGDMTCINHKRLKNVWLGTSVSEQKTADRNIPLLIQSARHLCPVLFVSYEPALGPVDFGNYGDIDWVIYGGESGPEARDSIVQYGRSTIRQCNSLGIAVFHKQCGSVVIDHDATIASPSPPETCWPEGTRYEGQRIYLQHKKGGDPAEWPEDLRVREFPPLRIESKVKA